MACVHQNYHRSHDKSVCCDHCETISCAIQAFPPQALQDNGDKQPYPPDMHWAMAAAGLQHLCCVPGQ